MLIIDQQQQKKKKKKMPRQWEFKRRYRDEEVTIIVDKGENKWERKTAVAASDGRDAADAADKGWLMVEKMLAHNAHDAPQNGWQGQSLNWRESGTALLL